MVKHWRHSYHLAWSNNALQLTAYSLRFAAASGSS
jgi:hypothetical protein